VTMFTLDSFGIRNLKKVSNGLLSDTLTVKNV